MSNVIIFKGQRVTKRVVKACAQSITYYTAGDDQVGIVQTHFGEPGGQYWRGWTALDADLNVIDGGFATKRDAEDMLKLDLATRP